MSTETSQPASRDPARPAAADGVSRGFPPVIGTAPRLLLLGSLPGRASLAAGEYYAMPRNAFWRIMGRLCGAGPEQAYDARIAALIGAGIALWDVLHAAERPGSLDARIVASTQAVNDIAGLVNRHPSLDCIGFNGQKAAAIFERHIASAIARHRLKLVTLPSTSPAFAAMSVQAKEDHWCRELGPFVGGD